MKNKLLKIEMGNQLDMSISLDARLKSILLYPFLPILLVVFYLYSYPILIWKFLKNKGDEEWK